MRRIAALSLPPLAAGFVITVMAVADRDRDPAFALEQRQPRAVEATALERTVVLAPEPVAAGNGRPGLSARCTPGTQDGELRNPWRCRVRYRGKHYISYAIRLEPDGSFRGSSPGGTRSVSGRVGVPAAN